MISWADYFNGRDEEYPDELTQERIDNALLVIAKGNQVLERFGKTRVVSSGWRPPSVNAATPGAAPKSNHVECKALDFADHDRELCAFLTANDGAVLKELDLYMEDPKDTPTWAHIQTCPPKSGRRIFGR